MTTPSIQTFYTPGVLPPHGNSGGGVAQVVDGFTSSELSTSSPLLRDWKPDHDYAHVFISDVSSGKGRIRFCGRLVSLQPATIDNSTMHYSRPYHYLVIKDDTGAIGIKLMPLRIPSASFVLGQLITVWATYVCEPPSTHEAVPFVLNCTSINPDAGTQQFLRIERETPETEAQYRLPLDSAVPGTQPKCLPGLVTLGAYLRTGHDEVRGLRILVCIRSIGNRKRVHTSNRDTDIELREVTVYDHTASCTLTLWENQIDSAVGWQVSKTILLISSPKWRPDVSTRRQASKASGSLSIGHTTLVDIDPDFADARWLRNWVKAHIKRDSICIPFPRDQWNIELAMHGPDRSLFTIAEVEDFARSNPGVVFTGKLNVVILEVNLSDLYFKKTLFCVDCCGVPLYANNPLATCKHCSSQRLLCLNPRILGAMVDETGVLEKGKQIWNPRAWSELFFPEYTSELASNEEEVAPSEDEEVRQIWRKIMIHGTQTLKETESLLRYARVTLSFGWSDEVGRLCVLGVE